ncbi:MAG: MurR/RpiR family transcriptional regulator, partial [Pygmaiobacter sp.]
MNENLFTRIDNQYDELSKTNKKVADYVRANANIVAFYSIKEFEQKSGVSTASISRFTKEIGFSGYSDFQKALATLILKNVTPMKEIKHSIEEGGIETILKVTADANLATLEALYSDDLQQNFNQVLDILQSSHGNIYIMASRSSFSVGYYLYFMLSGFLSNVHLLSDKRDSLSLQLSHIHSEDCLIAISYSKYSKITFEVTSYFAAQ